MPASRQAGDSDFLLHLTLLDLAASQLMWIESRMAWFNQQVDPAKASDTCATERGGGTEVGKGAWGGVIGVAEVVAGPVRVYL
jgi:hypothetical protein